MCNFNFEFLDQIGISIDDDSYEEQLLVELEKSTKYWFDQAQKTLQDRLLQQPNTNVAKNVIYFMGDGMSLTTITAARIFLGQLQGKRGEETDLLFQTFPNVGLAKVRMRSLSNKQKMFNSFLTFRRIA